MVYVPAIVSAIIFILYSFVRIGILYAISYATLWMFNLTINFNLDEMSAMMLVIIMIYAAIRLLIDIGMMVIVVIHARSNNISFDKASNELKDRI